MELILETSQHLLRLINESVLLGFANVTILHAVVIAGVVAAVIGFQIYIDKPDDISFATWFMFVFGDILEASSYLVMTSAAITMNAIPITFAIGSFIVFALALKNKQFGWPDWKDSAVTTVDVGITIGWMTGRWGATGANLMAVSTEVISFVPAYRDVLKGKERPYMAPWLWWALADALFFTAVVMQIQIPAEHHASGVQAIKYLFSNHDEIWYPLLQMLAHLVMVLCIGYRRRVEHRPVFA